MLTMPLEKGTEETKRIASMGGKASVASRQRGIDRLLEFVSEGGSDKMQELMEKRLVGDDLTKGEEAFIKDYKDFIEFVAGKRARVDEKGQTVEQSLFAPGDAEKILEAYGRANTKGDSESK